MSASTRILCVALFTFCLLLLPGCSGHTSIASINRDPGQFAGKDLTIAGHVSDSFGALGNGAFQVDDDTGTMWVLSQSYGVPSKGANVTVTGRLEQGFSLAGRTFAVILRETSPRH